MLQTNRFELRVIVDDDINNVYRGLSNPEVIKYYGVSFMTLESTREQMEWYANLLATKTGIWWGIYTKDTNEFCGAGGLNDVDAQHRKAEIGFWLLPEYWGRGILKEVMPHIFDYGFEDLHLNRIEGFVDGGNDKCKRAIEKVNFKYEGTMRQAEYKDGQPIDVAIYARLKEEHDQLKSARQ